MSLPKTSSDPPSFELLAALPLPDTPPIFENYRLLTQGRTIKEIVGGFVHTPTTKANFLCSSMQKWPGCRRYVAAFGGLRITPEQFEFLMGFPIGWSDLSA